MFSVWRTMSFITFQNQQSCPFEDQKESDSIHHRVFEVVVLLVEVGRFAVVRKDPLLASHENFMKVWVKTMIIKSANSPKKLIYVEINRTKLAQTFPKIWLKVSSRWCQNFWPASILTFAIIYIILFDHCGIHTLSKVFICYSKTSEATEHNAAVTQCDAWHVKTRLWSEICLSWITVTGWSNIPYIMLISLGTN